jgi:hypothetical protein
MSDPPKRSRRVTDEFRTVVGVGGLAPFPPPGPITALRVLGRGIEISLETDRAAFSAGRDPKADVHLPFPSVSRRHATLTRYRRWLMVRDHASRNGIWRRTGGGRVQVDQDDEIVVDVGDEFSIGDVGLLAIDEVHRGIAPLLESYCKRGSHNDVDRALAAVISADMLVLLARQDGVASELAGALHVATARRDYPFTRIVDVPASNAMIDELCTRAGCGTLLLDLATPKTLPARFAQNLFTSIDYHLWVIATARSMEQVYPVISAGWMNRRHRLRMVSIEVTAPLRLV